MHRPSPRRSIRLPGYDYSSAGAYFVTICAHGRRLLFEDAVLADAVRLAWNEIPAHFPRVTLDAFVIMPNHVHGILLIEEPPYVGATHESPLRTEGPRPGSLGAIVGLFKATTTRRLRQQRLWHSEPLWQRNYYERITRDDDEFNRIRAYIAYNPIAWHHDHENPHRVDDDAHDRLWAWLEDHSS